MKKSLLSFFILTIFWIVLGMFMTSSFLPVSEKKITIKNPEIFISTNQRMMMIWDGNKKYSVLCPFLKNQKNILFCDFFTNGGENNKIENIIIHFFYTNLSIKQTATEFVVVESIEYKNGKEKITFIIPENQIKKWKDHLFFTHRILVWYFLLASYLGLGIVHAMRLC